MRTVAGVSAEYRAHLLEGLATAVMVLRADLTVEYLNSAAETLFETSLGMAQGQPFTRVVQVFNGVEGRLREALDSFGPYTEHELQILAHGHRRTVDCRVTPVQMKEGYPVLIVEWVQVDHQLRITREEQMHAQQQVSRDLVRGMAHEIKNPLGGLRGAAQLLERELPDAELKEFTDVIIREADRLRALVDRMLGPNSPPDKKAVSIHQVLEHVRNLVEAEAGDELVMTRDYDPSIPDLLGDANMLIQSVLNIVRNAAQAMENTGELVLRTRTRRQVTIGHHHHRLAAQIEIIDHGPGIDAEMQERIFYPMVSGRAGGTGLGLSIAQSLISQHGGLIECSSEPGNTVFTILIPMELE